MMSKRVYAHRIPQKFCIRTKEKEETVLFENIRLSLKGILSHKIRSFLTMLGIIIGIAAIIAIVSTINGTNEQIKKNLIGAGKNNVTIQLQQGEWAADFSWDAPPSNIRMATEQQKQRILDLKEVEGCTLLRTRSNLQNLFYLNKMMEGAAVYGIDEDGLETMGYDISQGVAFTEAQYHDFSKVALIDNTLARGFFSGLSAKSLTSAVNPSPSSVW